MVEERFCQAHGCQAALSPEEVSHFCSPCRQEYSQKALELMETFDTDLGGILVQAAKTFTNAQGMADYLGVSLPTLYAWISRYHCLTFKEFKRKYICRGQTCIVMDYKATGYDWKYTMADRIHGQGGCMCFVEGSEELMMTTLKPDGAEEALRSEAAYDKDTGIYHLRYPVRLPLYASGSTQTSRKSGDDEG